jgi:hypothetical protein
MPGRVSIHPTTPDEEIDAIVSGVSEIARSGQQWADDYSYSASTNEFHHRHAAPDDRAQRWFDLGPLNPATLR